MYVSTHCLIICVQIISELYDTLKDKAQVEDIFPDFRILFASHVTAYLND